jgi:alpha-ketoglutaric semialdehyde dehydrogenase
VALFHILQRSFIFDNCAAGTAWESPHAANLSTTSNVNPSDTNDIVGEFANATAAQVDAPIGAARHAFASLSRASPRIRADLLDKVGNEILSR